METITRYGTETEYFGTSQYASEQALREAGISAEAEDYNHHVRDWWKVTTDSSVSGSGLELVSPVLSKSHLGGYGAVFGALRSIGAVVDTSCGTHVHHSFPRSLWTPGRLSTILETYAHWQPTINTLLSASRRSSQWAQAIPMEYVRRMRLAESPVDVREVVNYFGRYYAVNFDPLVRQQTVEFRQHQGTLNDRKIGAWVRLTALLLRCPPKSSLNLERETWEQSNHTPRENLGALGSYLGASGDLVSYFEGRQVVLGTTDLPQGSILNSYHNDEEEDEGAASGDYSTETEEDSCYNGCSCGECGEEEEEEEEEPATFYCLWAQCAGWETPHSRIDHETETMCGRCGTRPRMADGSCSVGWCQSCCYGIGHN